MAFDPSIFGMANRPTVALQSPTDAAMKVLQLQQATQQGQLQALQIQQQTQAIADANAFRNEYGTSPGLAKAKHDMATASLQEQKAAHDAQKAKIEALSTHNQRMAAILGSAQDQPSYDAARAQMAQEAQATGMPMGPMPEIFDPGAVKQMLTRGLTVQQQLDRAKLDLQRKEQEANAGAITGGIHADPSNNAFGVTKTGKSVPILDASGQPQKMKPSANPINIGLPGSGGAGGLSQEALDLMVEKFRKTGDLPAVGQGKAGTQLRIAIVNGAAAKDKAEGTVTDLADAKKSFKTQQDAMKFFTTGKGADAMRQQETILHHAKVFQGIADALNNGDAQLANRIGNEIGVQFGSDKATNLKVAGQIFSAEVGKYLAGSMGSAEERAELAKLLPMFNSPEQFKGALTTLANLVEGQRKSWMRQRTAALSGKVTDESGGTHASPSTYKLGQVVKGYVFLGGDPTDQKSWKKQ